MPRRSVVLIVRSLGVGGAQVQLAVLARGLAARGWTVTVMTLYADNAMAPQLGPDVRVICVAKRGRWNMARPAVRLFDAIRCVKPDVMIGYMPDGGLLASACRVAAPRAAVVWSVRAAALDLSGDWLARLVRWVAAKGARLADAIVCNSVAGAAYHALLGYPVARLSVIPNGIDVERFAPSEGRRERWRRSCGVAPNVLVIGIVGRMDPVKGYEVFLDSAAVLAREQPYVHFVCVGDGPERYREDLRVRASLLGLGGRVTWVAAPADMADVYNGIDVLTSASTSEGFPNVVGEAMATTLPCVVTDVGDSAAIVGDTGVVVRSNSAEAVVEGWRRLIANGAQRSAAARARVVARFGLPRMVDATEAVLDRAIAGRS